MGTGAWFLPSRHSWATIPWGSGLREGEGLGRGVPLTTLLLREVLMPAVESQESTMA